jgi:hypothetical protein
MGRTRLQKILRAGNGFDVDEEIEDAFRNDLTVIWVTLKIIADDYYFDQALAA